MAERNLPKKPSIDISVAGLQRFAKVCSSNAAIRSKSDLVIEMLSICTDHEMQIAIIHVLEELQYIPNSDILPKIEVILDKLINSSALNLKHTFFVCSSDEATSDGSDYILQLLRNYGSREHHIDKDNFLVRVSFLYDKLDCYSDSSCDNDITVVLVDDFIGTGSKVSRQAEAIESYATALNLNVKIKTLSIAIMESGYSLLISKGIDSYASMKLDKAITATLDENTANQYLDRLSIIEEKVLPKNRRRMFRFGYKQSEAAFSIEGFSAPNNNFAFLWWRTWNDNSDRQTLLYR